MSREAMSRETLQLEYDHFGDNHFEFVDKKKNRRVSLRQIARSHMELERQLAEARGFADELIRKLILNKEGSLSNKEVVLSLFSYFEEQLKEKGE